MTSAHGRTKRLAILNPRPQLLPGPKLLHDFALQCCNNSGPSKHHAIDFLAADASRQQLSYSDLNERSDHLAAALLRRFNHHGILGADRIIVPVFIPQCLELYVSLLAVLKAGAAFCPQALDAPPDRLSFVFGDVGAKVVLTTAQHRHALPALEGIEVFCVDDIAAIDLNGLSKRRVGPQHPAYVLYTSGSTGTPKGVVLSHLAVTQSLLAHDPVIPHYERFLQFASPTFDVSMFEIFFTFSRGSTLIACDRRRLLNDLPSVLNDMQVDGAELTPTVAGSLLGSRDQVPGLQVLLTIGEMLTRHVIDEFGAGPDRPGLLQGMYGPTEAAIHCTLQADFTAGAKPGIIGIPLCTVSAFIIAAPADCGDDPTQIKILQVGEVGELAVGGHQLADGYLNREPQTKAAFIPTKEHGMLYRTGDKARLLEDGTLECLGRISSGQIKLRGMRMELGEIEHAAATAKGCRVAVASVLNQNLIVFCLVDEQTTHESVLDACKKWLPSYMVPNEVVLRQQLPQLPSGKVDRKKLETEYAEASKDDSEPRDEHLSADEEIASKVLQAVLGNTLTLGTKLAQLGVDSLSAIRIASELRQKGYSIGVVEILGSGTLRGLGRVLQKCHSAKDDKLPVKSYEYLVEAALRSPLLCDKQDTIDRVLPCSPLQASMLAETKQEPSAYCNWVELCFEPDISVAQIRGALSALFQQNDILRSGFALLDGVATGFVQVVRREDFAAEIVDVEDFSYSFTMVRDEDFMRPLRVQIQHRSKGSRTLLQIHHALYDGWSIDLLINDIDTLLQSRDSLTRQRPQFAQIVDFYDDIYPKNQDPAKIYWKSMLRGFRAVTVPKLRNDDVPASLLSVHEHKSSLTTEAIRSRLPSGQHPQTLFQGALAYLLSCYLGTSDVVFGSVTSGRTIPVTGVEDIIGPCIATVPFRISVDWENDSRRLLQAISTSSKAMLEHCTLPLQQIKSLSGIEPGQLFFDVLFIWQESLQSRTIRDSKVKVLDSQDRLEFNIVLEVEPHEEHIALKLRYRESLWSLQQAQMFIAQLEAIATHMLDEPASKIGNLSASIPSFALSFDASAATTKSHNPIPKLDVPEGMTSVVVQRSKMSSRLAPRGAVGQVCWVSAKADNNSVENTYLEDFETFVATGFSGRMLSDSSIVRVDPIDNSQKSASVSSEDLEEIGIAIGTFRHVETSMATTIASDDKSSHIVAFWVPEGSPSSESSIALGLDSRIRSLIARLYDHLLERLPQNLIPSALIPITCLSASSDPEHLENIYKNLDESYKTSVEYGQILDRDDDDWSDLELAIAVTVASIAGVASSEIKLRTSFFSLGVNSITAISLARALTSAIDNRVDAADILRNPSASRLAAFLLAKQVTSPSASLDIDAVFDSLVKDQLVQRLHSKGLEAAKVRPCTPLQEAMLAAELSGNQQAYQNHTLFSLKGDPKKIQTAMQHLCSRHEILRTCFFTTDDRKYSFAQVVLSQVEAPIKSISSGIEDHHKSTINAVDTGELPFSITFEEGTKNRLLLTMHHALYDGQAMEILLYELEQLYFEKELQPAPSFDDFLSVALNSNTDDADSFWDIHLDDFIGAPIYRLPEESAIKNIRVESNTLSTDFGKVETAAKRLESTPLSVLQAAWATTLSVLVDESDICFGNVVSGRTATINGVDRLVAPCFNTIPVRLDLSNHRSQREVVQRLQSITSDSLEFQYSPLRRIQARWNNQGEKLFDTLFLLQSPARALDNRMWAMQKDAGDMGFPVVCELIPETHSDRLVFNLHHDESLLSTQTGKQVWCLFEAFLQYIVDGKDNPPDPANLVPDLIDNVQAEKKKTLEGLQAFVGDVSTKQTAKSPSGLLSRSALVRDQMNVNSTGERNETLSNDISLNETESIIRTVLAKFIQVPAEKITRQRTIFQLGLDSISVIQVAKSLRDSGIAVNAEDMLAYPSIATLNQALRQGSIGGRSTSSSFNFDGFADRCRDSISDEISCDIDEVKSIMPCTAVQAGIIAQFLHTQGATYLNHWIFELDTSVNLNQLNLAWRRVCTKYDMLRTGFVNIQVQHYPFAAVCYRELPEMILEVLSDSGDNLPETARSRALASLLHDIHSPVWRSYVFKSGGQRFMQFSALHAIFDAKCLALIFSDLWRAYEGHDIDSDTTEDVKSLAGVMLTGAEDKDGSHQQFWTDHLSDGTPCRFPNLTPERSMGERHMRKTTRSSFCPKNLVQKVCQDRGITLQAALQASFAILLSAYVGDPSVTFGVVLSGRTTNEAETVAFPTAVTLPFHAEYYDNPGELLDHTMKFNGSVRKHQFSPLTDIQRWVSAGKSSLFDCLLVFQETGQYGTEKFALVDEYGTAEYSLSLEIDPGLHGHFEFSLIFWDDVMPCQHAELMLRQFDQAFASLLRLEIPDLDDKHLSVQAPLHNVLETDVTYLHECVERTALASPTKPALEFNWTLGSRPNRKTWTYADLDAQGNRMAQYLLQQRLAPGGIIAICFDKCPEASFATYGILKAGSGFVAIDHGAPIARKAFIVKDSEATTILTMSNLARELREELSVPVIALDEIDLSTQPSDKPDVENHIDGQSTCYCLYTSGSTGTPKGCLISHYNAVQGLLAFKHIFDGRYTPDSRWLQFASFHFDVSVLEQFWSWMVGICVVSAPRDIIFENLAGALHTLAITHLDLTPSLARLITPEEIPSLCNGVFITGGEQLRQEVLDDWGGTGVIHNFYGPSECTIGVTVNPGVRRNGKTSNIGHQFINVGTFVFKPESFDPVLRGTPGELCIYGPLVGKGYLNRPELTEERFPYLESLGQRIYRTGDLVRVLHDGSFDFLGRIDDQVKLRGQRLELGEINNAVRESSDSVMDSHTLVIKDAQRHTEQIVAFVVCDLKEKADTMRTSILDGCKGRLPTYMVPSQITWVENALPLTPNNKVDVKALRSLFDRSAIHDTSSTESGSSSTPLANDTEHSIAKVLAEYMNIDKNELQGSTNIFQAGLDSISVFSFVRALRRKGLRTASTQAVMKSNSIADLAIKLNDGDQSNQDGHALEAKQAIIACIHQNRMHAARVLDVHISRIETLAPCTPLQQGMIARSLESEQGGPGLYFTSFIFKLSPDVDLKKLRNAWFNVIRNAQILRTEFVETNEGHIQAVLTPHDEILGDMVRIQGREASGSVLVKPLRVMLDNNQMTVKIFHALYDANSLQLLLESLSSEYHENGSFVQGPSFFEALPYGPLRKSSDSRTFWTKHLHEAQFSPLVGSLGPTSEEFTSATSELCALSELDNVRRKLQVTHQALVQSCWASVLQSHLRAATAIGLVVSGRSIDFDGADRIIGPMFNTLPFFAGLNEDDTFATAAKRCHKFNIEALPYQHTSLSDINKWTHKPGRPNLFDSLFVFQKAQKAEVDKTQDPWEQVHGRAAADYPLAFEADQTSDETLRLHIVALTSISGNGLSKSLMESFKRAFVEFLKQPNEPIYKTLGQDFVAGCARHDSGQENIHTDKKGSENHHDWTSDTSAQHAVASELAALAGVDITVVAPETSIFELGLDSIDAIKLSSRVKQHGIELPVSAIMRAQTVTAMAKLSKFTDNKSSVNEDEDGHYKDLVTALDKYAWQVIKDRSNVESIIPVTPLQEAMIAEMYATDCENYFNHDVLALAKDIDKQRLKVAWETVVAASPILRTSFLEIADPEISSSFAQVIHCQNDSFWTSPDESCLTTKDNDFEQYYKIHQKIVLNDKTSPPLRMAFVQTAQGRFLVLSIAHALYDGFSLGLLHEDVKQAYYGHVLERPSYDPVLKNILHAAGTDAEQFWADSLQGVQSCKIPQLSGAIETYRQEVNSKVSTGQVNSFCKEQRITAQALAYTVWSFVLATYASTLDTVSGLVLAGRDDEVSQELLFPTMNTVAVRSIIHGTNAEMLQYSQSSLASVSQHQHFPLRKVHALCGNNDLFNALFIFQKRPGGAHSHKQSIYESLGGDSNLDYPVAVEMEMLDDRIVWRAACSGSCFSKRGTEELLSQLDEVLKSMMDTPEAATLHYSLDGTSVCGLPSFHPQTSDHSDPPGPDEGYSSDKGAFTPKERSLCEVLAAVSKVPIADIAKDYSLFNLGLDSISAIKVSSLLRSQKGLKISVSEMLRAGSVERIAEAVKIMDSTKDDTLGSTQDHKATITRLLQNVNMSQIIEKVGVPKHKVEQILPATAGQVYTLCMSLNSKGHSFWPTFKYRLSGLRSVSTVQSAWKKLVAATPVLRTSFVSTDDDDVPFLQVVLKADADTHAKIRPMVTLRATPGQNHVDISLRVHHAMYDAISLERITQELLTLCASPESMPSWTSETSSLATFIASLSGQPDSTESPSAFYKAYLTGRLADSKPSIQVPHLPWTAVYKPTLLSHSVSEDVLTWARTNGLSVQSIFLAVFAKVHAARKRVPAHGAMAVGIYLANRSTEETTSLAAPTLNFVPILAQSPTSTDILALARQMQHDMQTINSSSAGSHASLWRIKRETGVDIDAFVNFLPIVAAADEVASSTNNGIKLETLPTESSDGEVEIPALSPEDEACLDALQGTAVANKYTPCFDVEAAIRPGGGLDVGVFGPEGVIRRDAAEGLIAELGAVLEKLVSGSDT